MVTTKHYKTNQRKQKSKSNLKPKTNNQKPKFYSKILSNTNNLYQPPIAFIFLNFQYF